MKSEKLNQWLAILANFGVLAGLIFVGMQLMLDRNIAIGEQYQLRAQTALENARMEISSEGYVQMQVNRWENGDLPRWWTSEVELERERMAGRGLTLADIYLITRRIQITYLQIDNAHFQFEKGLLENENWPPYQDQLQSILQSPLAQAFVLSNLTMRPSMRQLVIELVQENNREL